MHLTMFLVSILQSHSTRLKTSSVEVALRIYQSHHIAFLRHSSSKVVHNLKRKTFKETIDGCLSTLTTHRYREIDRI